MAPFACCWRRHRITLSSGVSPCDGACGTAGGTSPACPGASFRENKPTSTAARMATKTTNPVRHAVDIRLFSLFIRPRQGLALTATDETCPLSVGPHSQRLAARRSHLVSGSFRFQFRAYETEIDSSTATRRSSNFSASRTRRQFDRRAGRPARSRCGGVRWLRCRPRRGVDGRGSRRVDPCVVKQTANGDVLRGHAAAGGVRCCAQCDRRPTSAERAR